MKLIAKMMIKIGKETKRPGDRFEVPQSQATLLIQNNFAEEDKGKPDVKPKEPPKTVKK